MSTLFLKKNQRAHIDVTYEDQQKICEFSVLHNRMLFLKDEISEVEKKLNHLDGLSEEIEFLDDGEIFMELGEAFVAMDPEDASDAVERMQSKLQNEKRELSKSLDTVNQSIVALKGDIKRVFGDQINLE
ncbi:hypothetical protein PCE1_001165 [Barthelona sp. PCE]